MNKPKVIIGSDHAGFELKNFVKRTLEKLEIEYYDMGSFDKTPVDYPIIAKAVAGEVADGKFDRGIIICGSGVGVAMTANKIKEIRAANCNDLYCAKMSRLHNDANILTLGGRVVGEDLAAEIVKVWLETVFEGGRHQKRIDLI